MTDWVVALAALEHRGEPGVLVTVAAIQGSAPREPGTRMVVSKAACYGTIGGGNLEFKAVDIARQLLDGPGGHHRHLERFPLGPALGQCCGGTATLLFERITMPLPAWTRSLLDRGDDQEGAVVVSPTDPCAGVDKLIVTNGGSSGSLGDPALDQHAADVARALLRAGSHSELREIETGSGPPVRLLFEVVRASDFRIVLFGAGHVGKALVQVLQGLPSSITWVDSRADEFPDIVPANVTIKVRNDPVDQVDRASSGSFFLIMTHSHALDQAICERVLRRGDVAYCGLIGSATKLRKFQRRMTARGLPATALENLTCPIGIDGISGKHPSEIAIAVAAQLLQVRERRTTGPRQARPSIRRTLASV